MAFVEFEIEDEALQGHLEWIKRDHQRKVRTPLVPYEEIEKRIRDDRLQQKPGKPECDEFVEYKNKFNRYFVEFYFRSPKGKTRINNLKNTLIDENLAKSLEQHISDIREKGRIPLWVERKLSLKIDLSLSKKQAKKYFDKSCESLWNQIEKIYDKHRNEAVAFSRLYDTMPCEILKDFPLTSDGKKSNWRRTFEAWDKALKVYDLYEAQDKNKKNYAEISRQMGWFNALDRQHCSEEVKQYVKYAERLIMAASQGKLYEEACKPMTEGKKRKNNS